MAPRLLVALALIACAAAESGCGARARAQSSPQIIQPTPDRTMDAVVRGVVTIIVPTSSPPAHATPPSMGVNQVQLAVRSTETPAMIIASPVHLPPAAPAASNTETAAPTNTATNTVVATATAKETSAGLSVTKAAPLQETKPTPTILAVPTPDDRAVPLTAVTGGSQIATTRTPSR